MPKVLLIDDEVGFTQILKMNLEQTGEYDVRVENDSRKAVAVAVEFRPDVVLLDISMPWLDGGEVAAQFAAHPVLRDVPIIMLTALVSPNEVDPDAVVQAGSMKVLPKPVSTELLRQCIVNTIEVGDPVGV